jgi:hypothetical protein
MFQGWGGNKKRGQIGLAQPDLRFEPPRVYRRLFGLSHAAWRSELMG